MSPEPLGSRRDEFDLPADIAYFNTANLSPLTHRIREAAEQGIERRARPWTIAADDWFSDVERLRELFATLTGADAEGVALVPATSYGFAVATRNLELSRGDRIVVLAEEYPSGIYSWRDAAAAAGAEIVTVGRGPRGDWTDAILEALTEPTAVVSVPHVHWTDGSLVDLDRVADRAHELDSLLVIDASQSLGALPLDLDRVRPDYLISVGYKWLFGPVAVSYLWVAPEHRAGEPLEQNWISREGSREFARLVDYRDAYEPGARRFDMGQRSSFQLIPMAIAALEQLLEWQVPRIAATLAETTAKIADCATAIGLRALPADCRGPHMLGIDLPDEVRGQVPEALAAAGCYAAVRSGSLRVAPHLHNTPEEIARLISALDSALRR